MTWHFLHDRASPELSKLSLRTLLALAALAAAPIVVHAQSNLSTQGLGFAPGQISTRAEGTGGAIGEIDPLSLINPAALAFIGTTTLFFQIEPEYRSVVVGTATSTTTTARYPLFAAVIPVGSSWAFGVTSATLLDRTWTTTIDSNIVIAPDTVASTFIAGSSGSINDLQLAAAWTPTTYVRLGLGGHLMSGSDRVFVGRTFTNNSAFGNFADSTTIGFDGGAVSGGIELVAPKIAIASASFRKGGALNATRNDTALAHAHVPDRLGFSLAYVGIAGSEIAVRTAYDKWSSLKGLTPGVAQPVNAWDTSVGADIAGPHLGGGQPLMLRLGGRWRTLPYGAGPTSENVTERTFTAGLGTSFAGGRVISDLAVLHSNRVANLGISERAWTLSIGLGVRP
ncbi:MAG TPA: hypothetical protein VGH98_14605 [Gemmatimonadaceae bacterium]|jgi:hypothetical protein